jgi:N5-(cytidine 5'-diphosphoramidyl)-L-glutamine hydrolase
VPDRGERRDVLDQAWVRFLARCGCVPVAIPNEPCAARNLWQSVHLDGVLFTGGNDLRGNAPERDETELSLLGEARRECMPVIGVCRGMQLIQSAFGIPIHPTPGHVTPRQEILLLHGVRRAVNSYHDNGTFETIAELPVWARADDGVIKAVRHVSEPLLGIMWHPERLIPFHRGDLNLFRDHFGTLR